MKNILLIESSPRGKDSYSHQAARSIVNEIQTRNPGAKLVVRNLAENPPPHVGPAFIGGMYTPAEQRTPEQVKALAVSDVLIDEVFAAETIVLAAPMHNFGPPSCSGQQILKEELPRRPSCQKSGSSISVHRRHPSISVVRRPGSF